MSITVTPLQQHIGAEISGIDLRAPLDRAMVEALEDAIAEHAVIVFRDQALTDDQQVAFVGHFGEIEVNFQAAMRPDHKQRLSKLFSDVGNIDENGAVYSATDRRRLFKLSNMLWHSDNSYKPIPARLTILSGRIIPQDAPDTEFADMRAGWDALPAERQAAIEGLQVEHSVYYSRMRTGFTDFSAQELSAFPPVHHPLVRKHWRSGRKSIYVGAHSSHVVGWPVELGRKLVEELTAVATRSEFVYAHKWRLNDLVIFDNGVTMHRARPFDDERYKRALHKNVILELHPPIPAKAAA